jgi:hypothetical protein
MRKSSPLSRPADFPISSQGFKLACPWTFYRRTYRLRFGVDYWLTSAQHVEAPCNEVLVKELPGTMDRTKLQRLQELRHANIHAVLEGFRQNKTIYVVLEYMELSLHDIATVGTNVAELATILRQVRLPSPRPTRQTCSTFVGGRGSRVPLGAGSGARLADVL